MKITHVTTRILSTPADNPLVVGLPAPKDTREFVTLELDTDQGLVGIGLTFFGAALTPALRSAVDNIWRHIAHSKPYSWNLRQIRPRSVHDGNMMKRELTGPQGQVNCPGLVYLDRNLLTS